MRAEPAFDSEYGERGSSGSVSRDEPTSTEPYTSSVPMWTTRPTSRRRAMSTTMLVPKQLVVTKSSEPAIDRSTWLSAAKCTTASQDFIAGSRAAGSQLSPLTNEKRGSSSDRLSVAQGHGGSSRVTPG